MARRGKSQAKRNGGSSLPGWAWLLIGAVLALAVVAIVPKHIKPERNSDGFFRPRPNPEARPAVSALDETDPPRPRPRPTTSERSLPEPTSEPDYDFYTVLPGETALSDAELAENARAEANAAQEHEQAELKARAEAAAKAAATTRERQRTERATARTENRPPARATPPTATPPTTTHPDAATPATPAKPAANDSIAPAQTPSRYLLQAGAFSSAAEAETLKAQIALLGLQARIESGTANGKPVHRVRLGPYASANEISEIKQRLGIGGVTAQAVRIE